MKNERSDLQPGRLAEERAQVSPEGGQAPGGAGAGAPHGASRQPGALRNGGRWFRCRKERSPFCSLHISARVEVI